MSKNDLQKTKYIPTLIQPCPTFVQDIPYVCPAGMESSMWIKLSFGENIEIK
jgi:hypothetical protein